MRGAWLIAAGCAAVIAGGCFDPTYPENLACDVDGWCPRGQVCNAANVCVAETGDGGGSGDGGRVDAGPPDADDGRGELVGIDIGADVTIGVGETHQFMVTAEYENASFPVTEGVIWTSASPGIASVDFTGVVTGQSAGMVEITARWEGRVDVALVTVAP